MDSLKVPTTRHPIKIQAMDAGSLFVPSDDDDESGLGFQNTLVRRNSTLILRRIKAPKFQIVRTSIRCEYSFKTCSVDLNLWLVAIRSHCINPTHSLYRLTLKMRQFIIVLRFPCLLHSFQVQQSKTSLEIVYSTMNARIELCTVKMRRKYFVRTI